MLNMCFEPILNWLNNWAYFTTVSRSMIQKSNHNNIVKIKDCVFEGNNILKCLFGT